MSYDPPIAAPRAKTTLDLDVVASMSQRLGREPGIHVAALFGSAARGELLSASDIDIYLVLGAEFHWTSAWLASLAADLEVLAGRRVDLVVEDRDRTSVLLRLEVVRDGIPLFGREPWSWTTVRAHALIDHADIAESIVRCTDGVRRTLAARRERLDG